MHTTVFVMEVCGENINVSQQMSRKLKIIFLQLIWTRNISMHYFVYRTKIDNMPSSLRFLNLKMVLNSSNTNRKNGERGVNQSKSSDVTLSAFGRLY